MKSKLIFSCLMLLVLNVFSESRKLNFVDVKTWDCFVRLEFLQHMKDVFNSDVFVETGTYHGSTSIRASTIFESVYTTEIVKEYYDNLRGTFNHFKNINLYHGSSDKILKNILPNIKDKKIIFWLDAHHSGGNTGMGDYEITKSMTPVMEELQAIHDSKVKDFVIMIDDMRYFGKPFWPSLEEVKNKVNKLFPNHTLVMYGEDTALIFSKSEKVDINF